MMRFFTSACVTLSVAACGGSSLPPAKAGDTQSAISAAAAVGAEQHPQAALHLKMARDQLKQAQDLAANGNDDEAKLVFDRADADAQVALIITREAEASANVKKTQSEIQGLQNGPR